MCAPFKTADVVTVAQFNPNSAKHLLPRQFAHRDRVIRVFSDSAPFGVGDTVNFRETPDAVKLGGLGGHVTWP
jgi:hypothetical protein